jgi:hypothetical protein
MKLHRPGFPPVITDEPAAAAPAKPSGPKPFLTIEQARLAALSRHAPLNTGVQQPPSSTTQFLKTETEIIPQVKQQPLIDNNPPPATPVVNADGLTPEEEAELAMLLAKRVSPPK